MKNLQNYGATSLEKKKRKGKNIIILLFRITISKPRKKNIASDLKKTRKTPEMKEKRHPKWRRTPSFVREGIRSGFAY